MSVCTGAVYRRFACLASGRVASRRAGSRSDQSPSLCRRVQELAKLCGARHDTALRGSYLNGERDPKSGETPFMPSISQAELAEHREACRVWAQVSFELMEPSPDHERDRSRVCKPIDRFAPVEWKEGFHRVPPIQGSLPWIECLREDILEEGDHPIVIRRVLRVRSFDERPWCTGQAAMHSYRCSRSVRSGQRRRRP